MINALFGFRGRLGRLQFLGWNVAGMVLVAAIAIAFLILGAGLSTVLSHVSEAPKILGALMALTAAGVGIWTTLALTAKRLRDIGLNPFPVMIGATVLLAADYYILTRLTGVRFFAPFAKQTPLGGLIATSWVIFLICWPGASQTGFDAPRHRDARDPDPSDGAMRKAAIVLPVFIAAVSVVLLTPLNYFVAERHALAQKALASGWPSGSAALLSALADVPDARAQNNLGVLRARGVGTERSFYDARSLFAQAAERASARARLNAVMIANGRCNLNTDRAADTAKSLEPIAASDPSAASHIQDCLYFEATSQNLPDRDQRLLAAGTQVQQTNNGNVLPHSGWALLNRARGANRPTFGDAADERRYNETVVPLARKAMELLFAAADAGEPGAYEPLGILSMQFGEKLGNDPLAVRLRDRSNWEWLEVGAENGDWAAQCRVADARLVQLRSDRKPYTRDAFDAAVAMARKCIDRQETKREPQWYAQPEWLAVTPRLPYQARPLLEIASTEASLNGMLFLDADRRLNGNAATNTPGRKQ